MLISPAARHRLQELDPRWSVELIVRLVTSHFSLIALSLFAAVIEPWKRNFVHMNTLAPGAWQDGLPIAPLLLSVLFNTISSIYTLTRGKLAHPTFKLTADFLVWAFLIPAMALVIWGGAFRLWRPTVRSSGNSFTCTEENLFARECFPELYRMGSMELAGLGFAGATWLLHLSLFFHTCRATFTIRLRKSTMKDKHSQSASKNKSLSDSESANESDNEESSSGENGSATAQKRKREARGHRGKSRTGHTSRSNSRSRSRSRSGAKRNMNTEKKIEGSNTSVNKVRFQSPDLSNAYSDSDIQNEMRRDKERGQERRQRMRGIEREREREREKRRERARGLERDIERQRRRRREMERGREMVSGSRVDGDSRRSMSGANGRIDKSVDYKGDYDDDTRGHRSKGSTRTITDRKIKRKEINTTNGILKNKNSNTTLRDDRASNATPNENITARRDAGFKNSTTSDGRQRVGTGGSISSIKSNPWTDGEARKLEPPTVTTTITTETTRRNGNNSILKNRSSSGIVYTDNGKYNTSRKNSTSNGDNTTARGNDEEGPKGTINKDTTTAAPHLKSSLRRKPSSASNYSVRSINTTTTNGGGVIRSTSKSTNIRNNEPTTTTTTTTNNGQEDDIDNNNDNNNNNRPSLFHSNSNSNSNPHPRQNGQLRRDVVIELDTSSPRKELSVPYDMTVNQIMIPARAASRRGK